MAISFISETDAAAALSATFASAPAFGNVLIASCWNQTAIPGTGSTQGWRLITSLTGPPYGALLWTFADGVTTAYTPITTTNSDINIANFASSCGWGNNPTANNSSLLGTAANPPTITTTAVLPEYASCAAYAACYDTSTSAKLIAPVAPSGTTLIGAARSGSGGTGTSVYQIVIGAASYSLAFAWTVSGGGTTATPGAHIVVLREALGYATGLSF